jgi:hypothetical protein
MSGLLASDASFDFTTAYAAEVSDTDVKVSLEQIDPFEWFLMQVTDVPARAIYISEEGGSSSSYKHS